MSKFKSINESMYKSINKRWILVFFGLICSIIIILIFLFSLKGEIYKNKINEVFSYHDILKSHIKEFQNVENRLISTLSKNSDLKNFVLNKNDKTQVEKLFFNFVQSRKIIMQLRYIDLEGNELVRIDQDKKGEINIITEDELQNKAQRYYFQEFSNLNEDEIGYSKFDLNVENKKVEIPFNPTVRIGKAVYIDGKKQGIIVINYFMEDWLKELSVLLSNKYMIVNKDNYFMSHYDKNWEWSEYQNTKRKANEYPLLNKLSDWQKENKEVYLLANNIVAKKINFFLDDVLIVYKLETSINSQIIPIIFDYSLVLFLAFLFGILPISFLVYEYMRLIKQDSEYEYNILNNMFDALIVINDKLIIKHTNQSAEKLFSYTKEELLNKNVNILIPSQDNKDHNNYLLDYSKNVEQLVGKHLDIEAIDKYGKIFPISLGVTKTVLNDEVYFIGIIRDLSEVKELELINKKQEKILMQQTKLASMGEMIGAIAHQWRQPLNELSIRIQKLKYNYEKEQINEAFIQEFIEKNKKTISFMSKTIDDFRNFFRIDKEKKSFQVKQSIEEVINIQNAQLQNHNIQLEFTGEDFSYVGFKTEFQQVIINLISNSKDALVKNNIKHPKIKIELKNNIIKIEDNGGGIKEEVINRVFEPYFTTKEQGEGTGMGLYISKLIIEDNMNGKIYIKNINDGILITIDLRV